MRISNRSIDALKAEAADYFAWDGELPCFGVRVYASGRRSYLVLYGVACRTRRITLGLHGVLIAELAQRRAKVKLGEIAGGGRILALTGCQRGERGLFAQWQAILERWDAAG